MKKNIIALLFCVAFLSLNAQTTTLVTGWYYISETPNEYSRQLLDSANIIYINPLPVATAENFEKITLHKNKESGLYYILIAFKRDFYSAWTVATRNATGKKMAFILDNKLLYTPLVDHTIVYGLSALGYFPKDKTENYKQIIESEMKQ